MDKQFLNNIEWMNSVTTFDVKFTSDNLPQLFAGVIRMMEDTMFEMHSSSTTLMRCKLAEQMTYLHNIIQTLCGWRISPLSKYALRSVERIEPKEFAYEGYRDKFYNFEGFKQAVVGAYGWPAYKAVAQDVSWGEKNLDLETAKEIIARLDALPPVYVVRNINEPRLYAQTTKGVDPCWSSLDLAEFVCTVKPCFVSGGETVCIHVGGNYKG